MPTIEDDWIAKHRLSKLLASELAIARAASHLASRLRAPAARRAADEAATSAWWAAQVLTELVPHTVIRRPPRLGAGLTKVLRAAARLGDGLALSLLGMFLRVQARRTRWVLDILAIDSHEALLRGVLPQRMQAIGQLQRARATAATPDLEVAP